MKHFELEKNKSNLKTEVLAGITTFFACAYIIVVNPAILSQAGLPFSAVLTATILVSVISTLIMGIYANNPIVLAPGMGLNAFFTFTLAIGMKLPPAIALGLVFWSGIFFMILSVFRIRDLIVEAIPDTIQKAVACGIGFFIALIGLKNGGLVVSNTANLVSPGKLTPETATFIGGLIITIFFLLKRIKGGILWGILFTTLLSFPLGRLWGDKIIVDFNGFFSKPDFSLFLKLDLLGSLRFSMIPIFFTMVFTNLFDALSTFIGVSHAGGLLDERGKPIRLTRSLQVDALASTISGLFGTSPATSFIESATGIHQGGKTGITAITAGLLFFPFLFLSPLLSVIPILATAPALFIVGVFMIKPVREINWEEFDQAIPSFAAMILIPFTFSISTGIIWGFLLHTLCKLILGKIKEIGIELVIINIFCIIMLFLNH